MGYLSRDEEMKVVERMAGGTPVPEVRQIMDKETVLAAGRAAESVFIDSKISAYVVDIVNATRDPQSAGLSQLSALIEMGASTRASINLVKAAKALRGIPPHQAVRLRHAKPDVGRLHLPPHPCININIMDKY